MNPADDTLPEADRVRIGILRSMTGEQRISAAARLRRLSRELLLTGLRKRHPDESDERLQERARRIVLGDELFERAYGLR